MKTVKFFTLGCKVNQYETQDIRERLVRAGFKEPEDSLPADIYIVNTCTVTHKADADSLYMIRKAKRENPGARVVVTGCLAELDKEKIQNAGASLMIKNKDKRHILKFVANRQTRSCGHKGISYFKGHARAFLKIQDGCNNFCSYCKVPLVRGASRSRPLRDIVREAKNLVKNGYKEIVLCGICLGAYGRDLSPKTNLLVVINELEKIEGLLFIRLSSIEAKDITPGIINKLARSKKLCPHLHIPLQSGDDEILKKMNRGYSSDDFQKIIKRLKTHVSDIAITTDILVGFPHEAEAHFQNTLKLVRKILPLKVHAFPYSQREGTAAAKAYRQVIHPKVIQQRMENLMQASKACSLQYRKSFLHKTAEVLFERRWKGDARFWQGHTAHYLEILLKSDLDLQNKLVRLRLKKIEGEHILADFC